MVSELSALLPHQGPAILLDEVDVLTAGVVQAKVLLSETHPYATQRGVHGLLCIELWAQCAALSRSAAAPGDLPRRGVVLAVPRLELSQAYLPLDAPLRVTARLRTSLGTTLAFVGQVEDEQGRTLATGELLVQEAEER